RFAAEVVDQRAGFGHRVERRVRDEPVDLAADEEPLLAVDLGPAHAPALHPLVDVAGEGVGGLVVVVVGVEGTHRVTVTLPIGSVAMTIRVIQWATGTVGIHAVPAIVEHPDLELAGLWVYSDAKAGRDAGELCGIDPVGVLATQDADALLASDADVVCYMAPSDIRPDEVVDDLCRMLAAGKNVVNTSFVPLLYPKAAGEGVYDKLQAACEAGGTSFYTNGIDPGF